MELISASEAARRLGTSVSRITRLVSQGVFPNAFKLERIVRIPVSDLEAVAELLNREDGCLSPSEAGRQISVAPGTIKRWYKKGIFPNAFEKNGAIRIPQSDIDEIKKPNREAV